MSLTDSINIRLLKQSDINFILSSSIKCLLQYKDSLFIGWESDDLAQHLERTILHILTKYDCSIFIACSRDDEDHILGYIVAATNSNHILLQYTKYSYRKLGIQLHMLMPLVLDFGYQFTVQWGVRDMVKLFRVGRISVKDKLMEHYIENT